MGRLAVTAFLSLALTVLAVVAPPVSKGASQESTPGSLDGSFGRDGKVVLDAGGGRPTNASAVAIQKDGKIVVAGTIREPFDFLTARLNSDGSLDHTFDADGFALARLSATYGEARAVLIQPDSKILVAGWAEQAVPTADQGDIVVARYLPDGRLDSEFGTEGKVWADFDPMSKDWEQATALALQTDGKILTAGFSPSDGWDFLVLRLHPNGSRDSSFGSEGRAMAAFGSDRSDLAYSVLVQPDGRIVLAGYSTPSSCEGECPRNDGFALARFTTNGGLDSSFGNAGRAMLSGFGLDSRGALLQGDGRIVIAGRDLTGDFRNQEVALARFTGNGTWDKTFGNDGRASTKFGDAVSTGITAQPDGKILVSGVHYVVWGYYPTVPDTNFALARLTRDGHLDPTFGNEGLVSTDFAGGNVDQANALALQPDGRIVLAGFTSPPSSDCFDCGSDIALARYNAGSPAAPAGSAGGGRQGGRSSGPTPDQPPPVAPQESLEGPVVEAPRGPTRTASGPREATTETREWEELVALACVLAVGGGLVVAAWRRRSAQSTLRR